ncbi:PAS domain-containing protein [Sphingomonas sp. HDW15A]|uniref:response regulator transcription factor n=1 Tax=Sphingomonas sp. HDW15A TaxID=2714942 RepID=UPI001409732D|nr:response regulator transcription factor [Sphingomonas sp. HDW15A]QIK95274.1 PAS domain-containing protein [Sphingomonas sp. HDW15A]
MFDFPDQPPERKAFFASIELSPVAMVVTDPTAPDNPIRLANEAFRTLTGYSENEIIGRNCRFLTGPDTDPASSAEIATAIRERRPALVPMVNYRRDGTMFLNGVMIMPLFEEDGKLRWFLGSQVDLGAMDSGGLAARRARARQSIASLTSRQLQILTLIARGHLSKQIASELNISQKTVEIHRMHLLRRLGVRSSAEAIRLAIEAGL